MNIVNEGAVGGVPDPGGLPPVDGGNPTGAALDVMLTVDEVALLTRVRNAAQDNGSVFPHARRGEILYLDADDWNRLGKILDRIVQGARRG